MPELLGSHPRGAVVIGGEALHPGFEIGGDDDGAPDPVPVTVVQRLVGQADAGLNHVHAGAIRRQVRTVARVARAPPEVSVQVTRQSRHRAGRQPARREPHLDGLVRRRPRGLVATQMALLCTDYPGAPLTKSQTGFAS